jgi:transcriptional regulator with XRE-family HTH domain
MKKWFASRAKYRSMLAKKGIRTAQVCQQTGIPENLISQWLSTADRNIGLDTTIKLAKFFNVSVEDFCELKEI